jgi:hypothetical protein
MKKSEEWATDYLNGKVTTKFGTIRGSVGWGEMYLAVLFDKFAEEAITEYKGRVAQLEQQGICNPPSPSSTLGLASSYHNVQELRD